MTFYDFITGVGCFLLAGLIPGVPVIIVLVIHTWWFDRKQQQLGSPAASAPAHPYRAHDTDYVQRFVRVHRKDAWSCSICGACAHDDCDEKNHRDGPSDRPPCEWPAWAT